MRSFIVLLGGLLLATSAQASSLVACDFQTRVKTVATDRAAALNESVSEYKQVVELAIDRAANRGSHFPGACSDRVGTTKWLTVSQEDAVEKGDSLLISFRHVSNRTRDGFAFSETWNVIEDKEGVIAYSCFQITRNLPSYSVELREPAGPVRTDSLYYNVYVSKNGDLVASQKDVRVNFLSDQQGGMESILSFEGVEVSLEDALPVDRVAGTLRLTEQDVERSIQCAQAN